MHVWVQVKWRPQEGVWVSGAMRQGLWESRRESECSELLNLLPRPRRKGKSSALLYEENRHFISLVSHALMEQAGTLQQVLSQLNVMVLTWVLRNQDCKFSKSSTRWKQMRKAQISGTTRFPQTPTLTPSSSSNPMVTFHFHFNWIFSLYSVI